MKRMASLQMAVARWGEGPSLSAYQIAVVYIGGYKEIVFLVSGASPIKRRTEVGADD